MVFQTDSPQTTAHSSTVLSFRSLPSSTSLNTLKRLYGILSPTEMLRIVSKQQKISWKKLLMQAVTHTCLYWTSGIHHQKEWTTPLRNVSSRIEPVPHYPWLATCFSQKSFPMYTRICSKGKTSKHSLSTKVLKSCNR